VSGPLDFAAPGPRLGCHVQRTGSVELDSGSPGDRRADDRYPRKPNLGGAQRLSLEHFGDRARSHFPGMNHRASFCILWRIEASVYHSDYHAPFLFVLASSSPRRRDLLADAGFAVEVIPARLDETRLPLEPPRDYVRRLALGKATAVAETLTDDAAIVLGADTVVVVDGDVLGKPQDERHAATMLRRLSGREHDVLTGVALVCRATRSIAVETSHVTFVDLDQAMIDWYVALGESLDKAGGYGIQGGASRFIERIQGSYTNVVGLPVSRVDRLLRDMTATMKS
jgi:septum formation protein